MKITVQTIGFETRKELNSLIDERLQKLTQFSDSIIEAEVYLKIVNSDKQENCLCEIKLAIPGNDLFASRQSNKFEEAITQTADALKHQVITWKEKSHNR